MKSIEVGVILCDLDIHKGGEQAKCFMFHESQSFTLPFSKLALPTSSPARCRMHCSSSSCLRFMTRAKERPTRQIQGALDRYTEYMYNIVNR